MKKNKELDNAVLDMYQRGLQAYHFYFNVYGKNKTDMQIEAAKIADKNYPNLARAVLVKAFMNGFKTQANSGLSYTPMGLYGDE